MESWGPGLEVSTNVPARDPQIQPRLRAYQNVRNAVFAGFDEHGGAADDAAAARGGVYVETRFGESPQIHRVARPLRCREQLTFLDEPVKGCFPSPRVSSQGVGIDDGPGAGTWPPPGFIYGKDAGGNERIQFYLYNAESGEHTLLTDGTSFNYSVGWCTATGDRIAFSSNLRDGVHFDLYVLTRQSTTQQGEGGSPMIPFGMERSLVHSMKGKPGYTIVRGFEGNELLVMHFVSASDSRLFLLRVPIAPDWGIVDAKEIRIAPSSDEVTASVQSGVLTPGGAGVLFCCDEGTTFKTLRYFDKSNEKVTDVAPEIQWGVEDIAVGRDGDVVVIYNEDGQSAFYYARIKVTVAGTELEQTVASSPFLEPLQKLPWEHLFGVAGKIGFSKAPNLTRWFGFSVVLTNEPSDVYVADFGSSSEPLNVVPVQWTHSEVGGLNRTRFVKPHLIHYKSFDELKIPAFLYCPDDAVHLPNECASGREEHHPKRFKTLSSAYPVVIHPHGGPEGQHRPRFNPFYQYLVCEMGLCIIDPNVRGSAGYGKEFVSLDNCEKREDSVKDIGALLDWIDAQSQPGENSGIKFRLDRKKIAVWGGSYGGYMCLASLIHFNERFACGVDMVGISNFITFLESTAKYRRDLRRLKYGDERDEKMRKLLHKFSPLTNAHKLSQPLFVVHGAKDPRVPLSEARQIFELAKSDEKWWMLAHNEGHGFRKKPNIDAYQEAMVHFFRRFLLSKSKVS